MATEPPTIAELYDPATGTFSRSGNMTAGREQHTATLLSDGTVLFAGGHNVIDLAASAEIYGPVQNAFSMTASMPTARELHTATLLSDGRVLIAGGDDERYWIPETILSSAESTRLRRWCPHLCCSRFRATGEGKAQSGTPRQDRSLPPKIPPLPERFCRCTPPAW